MYAADPQGVTQQPFASDQDPFVNFFGPPTGYYKTSAYDAKRQSTWVLPEAFMGKSAMLGQTIEMLTITASNWYTQVAMPIERLDDIRATWNRWEYDATIAGIVPEMGVVRLLQSHRFSRTETFTRRGIGFQLEHGFMRTQEGIRHYLTQLLQLQQSIVETNNFGVLYAYLTAHDYNREWERKEGIYRGGRVRDVLEKEKWQWGILQQKKNGLDLLDAQLTEDLNRFRGEADMWIFPPKIQMYLQVVPEEKTDYRLAGPAGPQRLADGPEGFTRFKGSRVFLTRTFEVDDRGSVDYMRIPYQIGEHYVMEDRNRHHDYAGYHTDQRSIQVYDEDSNSWHVITADWALDQCGLFDEDGELATVDRSRYHDTFGKANKEASLFSYHQGADGEYRLIRYFGQMHERFLGTQTIYNLAQTALNSMVELGDHKTVAEVWKRGAELIEQMEAIEYFTQQPDGTVVSYVEQYLAAVQLANGGAAPVLEENPASPKCPSIFNLREWAPQPSGTLSIPVRDPAWTFVVPPMLQSAAGFRAMASAHQRGTTGGWNADAFRTADEFSRLVSALVQGLRRAFPNNLVTDASYASSWWHRPRAEDTLWENLIVNHRPAAWLATGATAAATAVPASAADLGSALLAVSQTAAVAVQQNLTGLSEATQAYVNGLVANYRPTFDTAADITNNRKQEQALRRAYVMQTLAMIKTKPAAGTANRGDKVTNELRRFLQTQDNGAPPTTGGLFGKEAFIAAMTDPTVSGSFNPNPTSMRNHYKRVEREFAVAVKGLTTERVQEYQAAGVADIDAAHYRRAPPGFSPRMMSSLAEYMARTRAAPIALPSDLNNPDSVVTQSALDQYTAPLRAGQTDRLHPYMQTYTSTNMELSVETTALVMNARSYARGLEAEAAAPAATSMTLEEEGLSGISSFRSGGKRSRAQLGANIGASMSRATKRRHGISTAVSDCAELEGELVTPNFSSLFSQLGQERPYGLQRIVAQAYLFTPVHRRAYKTWARQNVLLPIAFMVSRPHARYAGLTGIKAKAGRSTGTTFVGPSEFIVGDDAAIGVHIGSYKYYSRSVVTAERNVYVARAIFLDAYLGGMGAAPYQSGTYLPRQGDYGDGSMFVLALPYNERDLHPNNKLPNPLSLTGSFDHLPLAEYELKEEQDMHYSTAYRYNQLWGWGSMGVAQEIEESRHFVLEQAPPNYVTYRGHTWYADSNGKFSIPDVGTGHWGADATYIGCNEVRAGRLQQFKACNYGAMQQA